MPPRSRKPPREGKRREPQPKPPLDVIFCCLCKAAIKFADRNPGRFFQHLMFHHHCRHNHLHLLSLSLAQTPEDNTETNYRDTDPQMVEDDTDPEIVEDVVEPYPAANPGIPAPPRVDKVVSVNSEFLTFN